MGVVSLLGCEPSCSRNPRILSWEILQVSVVSKLGSASLDYWLGTRGYQAYVRSGLSKDGSR